jgi:hypothetical protein
MPGIPPLLQKASFSAQNIPKTVKSSKICVFFFTQDISSDCLKDWLLKPVSNVTGTSQGEIFVSLQTEGVKRLGLSADVVF